MTRYYVFWAPDTLADLISTTPQTGITFAIFQVGKLRLSEANYNVLGHSIHNNGRVNQKLSILMYIIYVILHVMPPRNRKCRAVALY